MTTAFLTVEVSPTADQPGLSVFQLRKLDLQLPFIGPGTISKDVQNQLGAGHDPTAESLLQVALLTGGQFMVDDQQISLAASQPLADFLEFALPHIPARMRLVANGRDRVCHYYARGTGEFHTFCERVEAAGFSTGIGAQGHLQDKGLAASIRTIEKDKNRSSADRVRKHSVCWLSLFGLSGFFSLFFAGTGDANVARRYHRRDGVFVYHLAHRVAQQHHKLIKRLYLTLQFDAVHQIYGYRHPSPCAGYSDKGPVTNALWTCPSPFVSLSEASSFSRAQAVPGEKHPCYDNLLWRHTQEFSRRKLSIRPAARDWLSSHIIDWIAQPRNQVS